MKVHRGFLAEGVHILELGFGALWVMFVVLELGLRI